MTRMRWSFVGLALLALGLSVGCGRSSPTSAETDAAATAPAVVTETVALRIEGMT